MSYHTFTNACMVTESIFRALGGSGILTGSVILSASLSDELRPWYALTFEKEFFRSYILLIDTIVNIISFKFILRWLDHIFEHNTVQPWATTAPQASWSNRTLNIIGMLEKDDKVSNGMCFTRIWVTMHVAMIWCHTPFYHYGIILDIGRGHFGLTYYVLAQKQVHPPSC